MYFDRRRCCRRFPVHNNTNVDRVNKMFDGLSPSYTKVNCFCLSLESSEGKPLCTSLIDKSTGKRPSVRIIWAEKCSYFSQLISTVIEYVECFFTTFEGTEYLIAITC